LFSDLLNKQGGGCAICQCRDVSQWVVDHDQGYQNWMQTDPHGFNEKLTKANQANNSLIKPLIRIMKYWNAKAGYPFSSYDLEQKLASLDYWSFSLRGIVQPTQLSQCFYRAVENLETELFAPQWKSNAVSRLKNIVTEIRNFEAAGQVLRVESMLSSLLPALARGPVK
jgi:hypothetical protein